MFVPGRHRSDTMQCTLMQARNERRMRPAAATLFTIGYQAHSVESLIECLKVHGVEVLMDVRQNPSSRKPGFSKRRLQDAISQAGIEYRHNPDLGTPPKIRNKTSIIRRSSISSPPLYVGLESRLSPDLTCIYSKTRCYVRTEHIRQHL